MKNDRTKVYNQNQFKNKKRKKILIVVGLMICICMIPIVIYSMDVFAYSQIDLVKTCSLEYDGYDGEGKASINCNVDYDQTSEDQSYFIDLVKYDIDNNGTLRNGDKVKLIANYSKKTADSLHIKVVNSEKEFVVEGLTPIYRTYEDIPSLYKLDFQSQALELLEKKIIDSTKNLFGPMQIDILEHYQIGSYYEYQEDHHEGVIHYLYRINTVEENWFNVANKYVYYDVMVKGISAKKIMDMSGDNFVIETIYGDGDRKKDDEAIRRLKENSKLEVIEEHPTSRLYRDNQVSKFYFK